MPFSKQASWRVRNPRKTSIKEKLAKARAAKAALKLKASEPDATPCLDPPSTPVSSSIPPDPPSTPVSSSIPPDPPLTVSASKRKLGYLTSPEMIEGDTPEFPCAPSHLELLQALFDGVTCKSCLQGSVTLSTDSSKTKGLSIGLISTCDTCGVVCGRTNTSRKSSGQSYEINRAVVAASLNVGIGHASLSKFCQMLGMPSLHQKTYRLYVNQIHHQAEATTLSITEKARDIVRNMYEADSDGIIDIPVTFDGTWHKRGHTSNHGAAAVICAVTGLVLDWHVMSLYCQICKITGARKTDPAEYAVWWESHKDKCSINFSGSSGGMEAAAAKVLWGRSLNYKIRYTTLIGDGDSKTFTAVTKLDPYNGVPVAKAECVNHVAKRLDRLSKETTVINQIFGGYLRSQVTCLRCQAKSNTFDPFMDLSLDIKGVHTVEDALAKFVKPETLDNENAYKCPKCRNKVKAHKRFSIQKPPNILTIQLNRFDFNRHLSGKINRFIKFSERINLRSYMSQRQGEPVLYHLYGVLVHSGHSSECGHYYSYVKSPSKTWYCMNDSIVHQANYQSVFNADAYVLFYARVNRTVPSANKDNSRIHAKSSLTPSKNSFIGPVLPNHMKQDSKSPMTNGIHGKPSSELGTPVPRQQKNLMASSSTPKIVPHATSLPDSHRKISFPILTTQQKRLQQQQDEKDDGKRIVLQIKHGNSTTMEKSPDGKSKVVNGNISTLPWHQTTGLVPYNDDDDSDAEQENMNAPSTSSKLIHSSSSALQRLAQDGQKTNSSPASGDNSSVKSSAQGSLPVPNGSGDGKFSFQKHHTQPGKSNHLSSPSPSKSSFIWEDSPPPKKPTSDLKHSDKENDSKTKSYSPSDRQSSPSLNKVSSHSFLKSQPSMINDKDKRKFISASPSSSVTPSPSSSISPSKASAKPNLALDLPAASSSKVKSCSSGTWYIHPHEGAPSPRGSCSSTNSVNSTSEWTVENKDVANQSRDKNISQPLAVNCNTNLSSREMSSMSAVDSSSKQKPLAALDKSLSLQTKTHFSTETKKTLYGKESQNIKPNHPSQTHSLTPVVISDKQSLVSPASSQSSETSSKKEGGSKNKRKLNCYSRDGSSSSPSESPSRKSFKKKKKKNKKHKKEKEDKKRLISEDSSDSESDTGVSNSKKTKSKDQKRLKNTESSNNESSSEGGYEWVEKTIESPLTTSKAKSKPVSVQSWNHHVKDDLATKDDGGETKGKKAKWDGARQSTVDKEFGVCNQDYKAQVLSWDGGKSQLTKDLEEDRDDNRKRYWSDEYNEELDAGKVKKVKKHRDETGYGSSYNPFQEYHYTKKKAFKEDSETSWSRDHSYYHRRDYHHHHNNNNNSSNNNYSRQSWHDKPYQHKYNNGNNNKVNGSRKFFK